MNGVKVILSAFLIFFLISCSETRKSSFDEVGLDSVYHQNEILWMDEDTISEIEVLSYSLTEEGSALKPVYEFQFYNLLTVEVDSIEFSKLKRENIDTKVVAEEDVVIDSVDSYLVLSFENSGSDTLRSIERGDYFEKYQLKGSWRNNYVIGYSNWEEEFVILSHKRTGRRYYLGDSYNKNASTDLIAHIDNGFDNPLTSSYLMISDLTDTMHLNLVDLILENVHPKEVHWVGINDLILKSALVDFESHETLKYQYYKLKLEEKKGRQ